MLDKLSIEYLWKDYNTCDELCRNGNLLGDAAESWIMANGEMWDEIAFRQGGASEQLTDLLISIANITHLVIVRAMED